MNEGHNYWPDEPSFSSDSSKTAQSGEVTPSLATESKSVPPEVSALIAQLEEIRNSKNPDETPVSMSWNIKGDDGEIITKADTIEQYFKEKIDQIIQACKSGNPDEIVEQHARLMKITKRHGLRKLCRELIYAAAEALPENQGTLDMLLRQDFIREVNINSGQVLVIVRTDRYIASNHAKQTVAAYVDTNGKPINILVAPGETGFDEVGDIDKSYRYYVMEKSAAINAGLGEMTVQFTGKENDVQLIALKDKAIRAFRSVEDSGSSSIRDNPASKEVTPDWNEGLSLVYKKHREGILRLHRSKAGVRKGFMGEFPHLSSY